MDPDAFVGIDFLKSLLNRSRATIMRMKRSGHLPPATLIRGQNNWTVREIKEWKMRLTERHAA
jgi:hypothetical protein